MPWLMKAEPDSRIVKGKDVKFSVDDFEEMGESPWDGVRNHEAKSIMRDKMKLGDKVLFYHSNCKVPGVFALAEISKEGYPDYTAWDSSHPYYDARSDKDKPAWYMVSVRFLERLPHPVTLANVKSLVGLSAPPAGVAYIGEEGLRAVQGMALINRGRLSVQPVEEDAYAAIVEMGRQGGFEEASREKGKAGGKGKGKRSKEADEDDEVKPPSKKTKSKPPRKPSKTDKPSTSPSPADEPPPKKATAEPSPKSEPKTTSKPPPKPKAEPKPRVEGSRRSSRLQK